MLAYIGNTIFNFLTDTIILSYNLNSSIHIKVPMLKSGITWWTDKYVKFKNPSTINLSSAFAGKTHILDKYSYLFIETFIFMHGEMFVIPPSLLFVDLRFALTFPTCRHLHHIPIRNMK